ATVLQEARKHYGCSTLPGMLLEDMGGPTTAKCHWKLLSARDDLMAPIVRGGYYTAMTIAAMEDIGYYKGNYDKAESMKWRRHAGCDLV
ncbi:MAG: leishmanolysin-related zinc metalloendopeptidase, partial [Providencia heimbachae]|nr:leishmanolysin-related zinc metalloendopeptidase [Providencia heimbachae]